MRSLVIVAICMICTSIYSQSMVNPIIKNFGGIYDVPDATLKPDPEIEYKIVIDLASGSERPGELNMHLVNIARMINLHGVGGVPKEKMKVVVAVHNEASFSIMDNESYRERFKTDNPNLPLYAALIDAGVEVYICGQSLNARNINRNKLFNDVSIATSMLTVLSTYQLKGYAWFKF